MSATVIDEHIAFDYDEEFCNVLGEVHGAIKQANEDTFMLSLVGECTDEMPYDVLIRQLETLGHEMGRQAEHVRFLKTHVHDWGEDDRCIHCGADGRA